MANLDTSMKEFASVTGYVLLKPERPHICPSMHWYKVAKIYCAVLNLKLNVANLEEMKR